MISGFCLCSCRSCWMVMGFVMRWERMSMCCGSVMFGIMAPDLFRMVLLVCPVELAMSWSFSSCCCFLVSLGCFGCFFSMVCPALFVFVGGIK